MRSATTKLSVIACLCSMTVLFTSCMGIAQETIKGQGSVITQTRSASDFERITHSFSGDLVVTVGDAFKVTVEGQANILEHIETVVENGTLKIRFTPENLNIRTNEPFRVYVQAPKFTGLALSGSGNVDVQSDLNAPKMEIALSGSGNIFANGLKTDKLEIALSGSGNVQLRNAGTAEAADFSLSGSGNIDAGNIQAKVVNCSTAGSGNISCYALNSLDVSLVGSGDVIYSGNPNVKSSVIGSGDVRKK